MTLDNTLAREIRAATGGAGNREARFAFLAKAREAAQDMSNPRILDNFGEYLAKHGRGVVAVCVAATIQGDREGRVSRRAMEWAYAVMDIWNNRPSTWWDIMIRDNLHPSRIEEYAGSLIRATSRN